MGKSFVRYLCYALVTLHSLISIVPWPWLPVTHPMSDQRFLHSM
jgi:hypothetical protein